MKNKFKGKEWYANAVALCIAVAFYVIITNLGSILEEVNQFIGYFGAVIIGLVLAYLMNPLAKLYRRTVFGRVSKDNLRWTLSVVLAVITTIFVLGIILQMLIPQLIDSIYLLVSNMDTYVASLEKLVDRFGLSETLKIDAFMDSLLGQSGKITTFLKENANEILNASATAGKTIGKWVIAFIMSVYMLMSKDSMKNVMLRLMHAVIPEKPYKSTIKFLTRCHRILSDYIVFSLLDAAIIGGTNAVFMAVMGMEYVGLVSVVVAVTNLIPTFGPIIGGVIGGFILLLVHPLHALIFVAFSFLLQFLDGYVIKPKLFGNKLGVSGLLIIVAVIVCGNIWGVVGILLAIPLAAILDFICMDEVIPALERRRAKEIEMEKEKK